MDDTIVRAAEQLIPVAASRWDGDALFMPPRASTPHRRLVAARRLADGSGVGGHDFFTLGHTNPDLLRLWASQEAIVTGPFSQLLLILTSQLKNVHIRAQFLEVVSGEHNGVKNGVANGSHPWLLFELCRSAGLNLNNVRPLPATVRFLRRLAAELGDIHCALGAFGVGNERMLLTEYAAVQRCFEEALPEVASGGFLRANIAEDTVHSQIIELVATNLADDDGLNAYIAGARRGIRARLDYYDDLLVAWKEQGLPDSWLAKEPIAAGVTRP